MPKERLSFACAHTFRFDSSRLAGAKELALHTPRHVPWSSQRMAGMARLTKAEARKTWEAAAPGWATWEEPFASGFRDATAQMLDIAAVAPGAKVLDLACGAGSQTFQAAERVGADGAIVASDISATMLSHVSKKAEQQGVPDIETLECAAEDLDVSHDFDAAICRLGLMLFPGLEAPEHGRTSRRPAGAPLSVVSWPGDRAGARTGALRHRRDRRRLPRASRRVRATRP